MTQAVVARRMCRIQSRYEHSAQLARNLGFHSTRRDEKVVVTAPATNRVAIDESKHVNWRHVPVPELERYNQSALGPNVSAEVGEMEGP